MIIVKFNEIILFLVLIMVGVEYFLCSLEVYVVICILYSVYLFSLIILWFMILFLGISFFLKLVLSLYFLYNIKKLFIIKLDMFIGICNRRKIE